LLNIDWAVERFNVTKLQDEAKDNFVNRESITITGHGLTSHRLEKSKLKSISKALGYVLKYVFLFKLGRMFGFSCHKRRCVGY
jgi:hypothetical protein